MPETEQDAVTQVEIHNTPDSGLRIEPVGKEPRITYHVDWQEMGYPSPQMFKDLSTIQVKLAVLGSHLTGKGNEEIDDAHNEAMEAVNELLTTAIEARDLDDADSQDVYMGNLEKLPEVFDREVNHV